MSALKRWSPASLKRGVIPTALCAFLVSGLGHAAGDPEKGKAAFAQCAACHSLVAGEKRVGPSLSGVVGRRVGSASGFEYSQALAKADQVWTTDLLAKFLSAPSSVFPGSRMPVVVVDPQQRDDLAAFLATQP